uniref:Uncharacterized protein n=1 Tax=Tanacetum cinerariifolium TaxID=118510 RepID=A0A6L2NXN0_TANCI|nr:hypothetical protein [Tanacetum cinerariifolium]
MKPKKDQIGQCIEKGPYILTQLVTPEVPAEGDEPEQPRMVREEIYINTTIEKIKLIDAKTEEIHMILNEIGESINIQDVKTKLFWGGGKFTTRDAESIESYHIRFYRMMNEMARNKLKVDTMQGFRNFSKECRTSKRVKDYENHTEKMMLCKQESKVPTYDAELLENVHTDDDYNVFATKRQHFKQPKSIIIPNSLDLCDNEEKADQNFDEPEDECV